MPKQMRSGKDAHAENQQPQRRFVSKAPLQSPTPMAQLGCQKKVESLVAKGRKPKDIAEYVYYVSESGKCNDSAFYMAALDFTLSRKDFDSAEDICQSAVVAHVNDDNLYLSAIDTMMSPVSFAAGGVSNEAIKYASAENACRILGSIALHNLTQGSDKKIDASRAFVLAVDRVWEYGINDARRSEDRKDRIMEIYANALDSEIDQSMGYDLFDRVYRLILENKGASKERKANQAFEVTAKTIRSKVSHTILFTKAMEFLESNGAKNQCRTLRNLLVVHKK
ncbi:Uncharacterised protein [uncultured archaeon]|nr:Uncharacterised protein [uncultured archaeon]